MSELPTEPLRCKQCDSVIAPGSDVCLMCGTPVVLPEGEASEAIDRPVQSEPNAASGEGEIETGASDSLPSIPYTMHSMNAVAEQSSDAPGEAPHPEFFESHLVERQSRIVLWMTGIVFVITAMLGSLVLQYDGPVEVILAPSQTPIPPTATITPGATGPGTATNAATETPSLTPEPSQTPTPETPRVHEVSEGETLFGLAYLYNVTMDVIAELNGFSVESPIQSGQTLQIPWPTATPPLEPIVVEINGEPVIADPTNCERYEVQEGDALSVIAARRSINFELLLRVNRLTDQSIMQPGDTICIPEIVYGEVLPPTPGPTPTPSPTSFPAGPALLFPTNGVVVEMRDEPIVLQWLAVKDLDPDEWYMIEVTDLTVEGQHPRRAFTRDNAFRIPGSWRPAVEAYHDFRWRISIVEVTGQREDGGFIYTFGGRFSEDGYFSWRGAVPTATPTATPTETPEP